MKLASLKEGGRDGSLVVVSRDLTRAIRVPEIARTMQAAMDDWERVAPLLAGAAERLEQGKDEGAFAFEEAGCAAPLPRAFQWCDASAYLYHVELVRKARKAEMPPSFYSDPLMYQGGSDSFIGARDDILAGDEEWGIDLEAEVAVTSATSRWPPRPRRHSARSAFSCW